MPHTTLPFGLTGVDPDLVSWTRARLDEVEVSLHGAVISHELLLAEASRHLAHAGGKRFRPLLALLGAQYGDRELPANVEGAVVAELTHLATLYHDDVMDEATVRRGAVSANARWGNTVAILTGDYLFARAADMAAGLGTEVVRLQARTFQRLVEGQIRETLGPATDQDRVNHHLEVLADKTGSLIAASARMGALTSGASPAVAAVLSRFGERIGIAFQLSDDLIDISSKSSGKEQGTDLREGIPTLPVLLVLADDAPEYAALRALLRAPIEDDLQHATTLAALQGHPAMQQARDYLQVWATQARESLTPLHDLPEAQSGQAQEATAALSLLCDAVITRST